MGRVGLAGFMNAHLQRQAGLEGLEQVGRYVEPDFQGAVADQIEQRRTGRDGLERFDIDLGDTSGKRRQHLAVATLGHAHGARAVGFLHLGVGHGDFDVTHRIELAQLFFRFQVLPGHGQFGGRHFTAGLGFVAVEAGEHFGFGDMLAETGFHLAQGAAHLAGQGGFQFGRQQHANGTGAIEGGGRRCVIGVDGQDQTGQQQGPYTGLKGGFAHSAFLAG
ncbi:hypothetical protein D3C80_1426850 [compost metagenome]